MLVAGLQLWGKRALAGGGQTTFSFVVVNTQVGGTDQLILNGNGTFSSEEVQGGGSFTHFSPTGEPPSPIVDSGTWRAKRFISFTPVGTYGAHGAGILQMDVDLIPDLGSPIPGTLEVVCNIAAGGLATGKEEGVTLTLAEGTFEPMGAGLTVFSRL
jgi:hypothetical protein